MNRKDRRSGKVDMSVTYNKPSELGARLRDFTLNAFPPAKETRETDKEVRDFKDKLIASLDDVELGTVYMFAVLCENMYQAQLKKKAH